MWEETAWLQGSLETPITLADVNYSWCLLWDDNDAVDAMDKGCATGQ